MKCNNLFMALTAALMLCSCSSSLSIKESNGNINSYSEGVELNSFFPYEEMTDEPDYSVFDGVHHDIVEDTTETEITVEFEIGLIAMSLGHRQVMAQSLLIDGVRFYVKRGTIREITAEVKYSGDKYHREPDYENFYHVDPDQEGYFILGYDNSDNISEDSPFETLVLPDQYQGEDIIGICGSLSLNGLKNLSLPKNLVYFVQYRYLGIETCSYTLPLSLETIRFSDELKHISPYLLSATKIKYFPSDKIEYVASKAYACNTEITKITLPKSVSKLWYKAFEDCSNMTYCDLSQTSIEGVSFGLFDRCTALKTVFLPNTIEYFDSYAFSECSSLEHIYYPGTIQELMDKVTESECVFKYANDNAEIVCYDGSVNVNETPTHKKVLCYTYNMYP